MGKIIICVKGMCFCEAEFKKQIKKKEKLNKPVLENLAKVKFE